MSLDAIIAEMENDDEYFSIVPAKNNVKKDCAGIEESNYIFQFYEYRSEKVASTKYQKVVEREKKRFAEEKNGIIHYKYGKGSKKDNNKSPHH